MAAILIIYSTTDGHTLKIGRRMKEVIESAGHRVELVSIKDEPGPDLERFDRIVIGASIRYGRYRPAVYGFVKRNREILERKPSAFFSVNAVARKPWKNRPETNPYVRKFIQKSLWKPALTGVFGGRIEYAKLGFLDRNIIRFIMWKTKGPTDPKEVAEFTDWGAVEEFGRHVREVK